MLLAADLALCGGTVAELGATDVVRIPNVAPDVESRFFGRATAALGDLDGDGVSDFAVGAVDSVFILMMNSDGSVKSHRRLSGEMSFGAALTSVGDLNGDGITDLAAGTSLDSTYGSRRGAVYLFLLNSDGTVQRTTTIASGVGGGPELADSDQFGSTLSLIGDLDGDGVPELAVGAIGDDSGPSGALYVLFLNDDGTVKNAHNIDRASIGVVDGDSFVSSASPLGDRDGDGIPDLAVGAAGDDTGGSQRGAVHILHMGVDGSVKSSTKIASDLNGGPSLNDGDFFGRAVTAVGDLDGDGVTV